MVKHFRIWVNVRLSSLMSAIRALKTESLHYHNRALSESNPEAQKNLRAEGDAADADAEELRKGMLEGKARPPDTKEH